MNMIWNDIDIELPAKDVRVLLCDIHGHLFFGTRDIFGYWRDNSHVLENIVAWAYPPLPPWGDSNDTNQNWIKMVKECGYMT